VRQCRSVDGSDVSEEPAVTNSEDGNSGYLLKIFHILKYKFKFLDLSWVSIYSVFKFCVIYNIFYMLNRFTSMLIIIIIIIIIIIALFIFK
jgi:hypothetical protein